MDYYCSQPIHRVAYAEKKGFSVGQLEIAWCLKNTNVSTVLLGATKPSQLEENFGAIDIARYIYVYEESALYGPDTVIHNGYANYNLCTRQRLAKMSSYIILTI